MLNNHPVVRRGLATAMASMLLSLGFVAATQAPASAASVRPGAAFGQVDLVLDGYDMQRVVAGGNYLNGLWAATVICWTAGAVGRFLSVGVCQTAVRTCVLRADADHRLAGLTVAVWPRPRWWCWEY